MAPRTSRDALLEKRRKIEAQLKALDARDREQKRKDDTRRKIIIGSLIMDEAETDVAMLAAVRRLIEEKASDKDRDFVAEWLAAAAAAPREEAAEARVSAEPARPKPSNGEAPKSSLILPGQVKGPGADKPLAKPSIILRP
jgi:hypothetical protein